MVDLHEYLRLLEYEEALLDAEEDLLRFAEVTMPSPKDPHDPKQSKYDAAKHHRLMASSIMEVERGERRKIIFNAPPRHGKSEICTRRACAWISARNPDKDIIVATYGEKFAHDFAKDVRDIMASQRFKQIFPEYFLTLQSNEHLRTMAGGNIFFLGRRSQTTGRGADFILVDDPTKDDREVKYSTFREDCWQWFTQTLLTRRHTDKAAVVVSQTRWHEDDIVGRLTDPSNPAYSERLGKDFEVINLPALATDEDVLGRKPGEALWPERFGTEYLEEMRGANPTSFSALYQSDPTPEDGVFYRAEEITEYLPEELPQRLQMYAVSDHAVATAQINDRTCLVPFGICENNIAWIMPHIVWRRMDASEGVEQMIDIMQQYKPIFWYAEKGQISRSIGPFLKKRMQEVGVYTPIIEEHPSADKLQRAHSARARCSQGRIRFPSYAAWWPQAKAEMLKFPNARFDDFVDTVSMIGMKLTYHSGPGGAVKRENVQPGTFGHLIKQFRAQDAARPQPRQRGW